MATKKQDDPVIVPLRNTFVITMISAVLFIGTVFIFIL